MKKKYFKPILLSLCIIFLFGITAFATNLNSSNELNWYFVFRGKGVTPEAPKESASFLKDTKSFYVGDTSKKELYLTFDEGYEKGNTEAILDILKEVNVKAAFFVVKPYITSHPETVKRMVKEGHLVCNHSSTHPSMASITDKDKFKKEFTDVEDAYKELVGSDMPKYFRPPMGKYSENSLKMTDELGYKSIFWSFAYRDWLVDNQPSESYGIEKIKNGAHPGGILLLHAVSDTNTKILKEVLTSLKDEGYEFKSLDELPEEMIIKSAS
ncbi:delta-lactam-biosynthetic de-N-acetylase [Clostridium baratii]|uniref:Delta-lactam-biosynthetic de-N-acetylase n=1 Tax=Clostridium baratii TaxID=1561 RepID=A0A174QAG2_9CLOT|nr:delta-lactam-biosynthetic de-N-acetylase [Clostridium baratii]CUP67149.1 delta-lactam-biosynthetic de-N-acetylase [Clostridium baratii]